MNIFHSIIKTLNQRSITSYVFKGLLIAFALKGLYSTILHSISFSYISASFKSGISPLEFCKYILLFISVLVGCWLFYLIIRILSDLNRGKLLREANVRRLTQIAWISIVHLLITLFYIIFESSAWVGGSLLSEGVSVGHIGYQLFASSIRVSAVVSSLVGLFFWLGLSILLSQAIQFDEEHRQTI